MFLKEFYGYLAVKTQKMISLVKMHLSYLKIKEWDGEHSFYIDCTFLSST